MDKKTRNEIISRLISDYILPADGADFRELAGICRPQMRQLCEGEEPEDWIRYTYEYLLWGFYPHRIEVEHAREREAAVHFFLEVLQGIFERERKELDFDPCRDFAVADEAELLDSGVAKEYTHLMEIYHDRYLYAFMRLSWWATPFNTLGHIAGVHHVATYMARQLAGTAVHVDVGMVSGASMIHDIGKYGCFSSESRRVPYLHYFYTYQFAQNEHLPRIGNIASNHSVWDLELENLSVESLLLIYADFRVKSVYIDGREEAHFYTLQESYDVILGKLDNVDEKKKLRYARVFEKLQDFEKYMISLGCDVAVDRKSPAVPAVKAAEPEIYDVQKEPALMDSMHLVHTYRQMAVASSLRVMYFMDDERFISLLESVRSEKDWRHVRAYLTVIEEYSAYLKQEQKDVVLSFLYDMLSHRDGDIRRQAASVAGRVLAGYEIRFTKEMPDGGELPRVGVRLTEAWHSFLHRMLFPGHMIPEQHRRWIGYAMKTVLRSLLAYTQGQQQKDVLSIFIEYYKSVRWDSLTCFFLLESTTEIPFARCNDNQRRLILSFVRSFADDENAENRVAALRFASMLPEMEEYRSRLSRGEAVPEFAWMEKLSAAEDAPACIRYLTDKIHRALQPQQHADPLQFNEAELYLENQRSENPWIFKYVHLQILREQHAGHKHDNYQYASHLLNMLQFTDRVVNKLQAGEDLVAVMEKLDASQKYEIVLELIRGIETGEYSVSRYIPQFLGRIFVTMPETECRILLDRFQEMIDSANTRVVIVALEMIGVIMEYLPAHYDDGPYMQEVRERTEGMLICGIVHYLSEIGQEALYVFGHGIFGSSRLDNAQKRDYFTRLGRKVLCFMNKEDMDLYVYYNSAALNHIYRFLIELRTAAADRQDEAFKLSRGVNENGEKLPVAFFPGTFDPFSLGHKAIVSEIASMGYEVYLATDEFSWSKRTQPHRLRRKIIAMSIADLQNVYLFPKDVPVNIANPKDLKTLKDIFAGREVWLVAGSDVIDNASAYRAPEQPCSVHQFPHILFARNSEGDQEKAGRTGEVIHGRVLNLRLPAYYENMSSTRIRENVSTSKDIANLVETRVQNYIYARGLYSMEPMYKKAARSRVTETFRHNWIDSDLRDELAVMQGTDEGLGDTEALLQRQAVVIRDGGDRACGAVVYIDAGVSDMYTFCEDIETAAALRRLVSGRVAVITQILGTEDRFTDQRLTALNEMLACCQQDGYSYALYFRKSGDQTDEILAMQGFVQTEADPDCFILDLRNPVVLFYDTASFLKEPFADNEAVREVIWNCHKRLCREAAGLYPGNLILCFESEVLNHKLISLITDNNPEPQVWYTKKKLGEKMCVPFGKILKGVLVPGAVTKDLNTEKLYDIDLEHFAIREYPQYLPLPAQLRTIRSFDRPILLVDDIYHKGYRLKALEKYFRQEGVSIDKLLVGVLSGRGNDLAGQQGLDVEAVYFVPNMRSWLIESDLYPFIGGDGVQSWKKGLQYKPSLASVNPVLPYEMPSFLKDVPLAALYAVSETCISNARDIYRVLEQEYQKKYGRKLTMERITEVSAEPRHPDDIILNEETWGEAPSVLLEQELRRLRRLKHLQRARANM